VAERHPRFRGLALLALLLPLLSACGQLTPERAQISAARPLLTAGGGSELDIEQRLRLTPLMLEALESGIPLRLRYEIGGCPDTARQSVMLDLRHAALTRRYLLQVGSAAPRHFSRRSAMLAALDRVRLPLDNAKAATCAGDVQVSLDLTSLPPPLRLPALLLPADWRLRSPTYTWPANA
jgi:hypothetical protein